jgi:putative transposase
VSYVKIWVHLVFTTKNREPLLLKEIRQNLFKHIILNCKEKNIFLQAINGYTEHIHCLVSVGKEQSIAQIAQLIKGESSHWINKNSIIPQKFYWQDDYYAVSVGESHVKLIVNYIQYQEQHHSKKSFKDELAEFLKEYGFTKINDQLGNFFSLYIINLVNYQLNI